jgi:hypothetical protein
MDEKWLWGAVLTLAGWIVSYRLGLQSGRRRAAEDLATRRGQLATALLVEFRVLETFLRRLRTEEKPLESHWMVPCRYLDATLASLDLLSAPSVREVMELYGLLQDITAYRERHPPDQPPTDFQNWFIRLKAVFGLQRIRAAKDCLVKDGGLLPVGGLGPVVYHPDLPPLPDRTFPEYDLEFDEEGNIKPKGNL